MKRWTTLKELKERVKRDWQKGHLLTARFAAEPLFPLRIPLRHPSAKEMIDSFDQAREWLEELKQGEKTHLRNYYQLEWQEANHRQLGKNTIPVAALFEREIDCLNFIGKALEAETFHRLAATILETFPDLLPWLTKRPHAILAHANHWPKTLRIMSFLQQNPRPGIYIRQLDIPGVDTKFIERYKKLLQELLDIILPEETIDQTASGLAGFEQRYGFTPKPIQIHFRILDPELWINGLSDLSIPVEDFARLDLPVKRVFITENIINGLAFPSMPDALVLFGLGYGLDRLAGIPWLANKEIFYWGDLDTHGFAMLDQARSYFPQTVSFLMDKETLLSHKEQWGHEKTPTTRVLPRLNKAETRLYNALRDNDFADALRLEQEKISFGHVQTAVEDLVP